MSCNSLVLQFITQTTLKVHQTVGSLFYLFVAIQYVLKSLKTFYISLYVYILLNDVLVESINAPCIVSRYVRRVSGAGYK